MLKRKIKRVPTHDEELEFDRPFDILWKGITDDKRGPKK